jgi:hypothetical protein
MIAGKDYSDDFDTASDDHKPRILASAIELRERFNKDDDDHDSGDEKHSIQQATGKAA